MSLQTNIDEGPWKAGFERLQRLAEGSRWDRFLARPWRYIWAQVYRRGLYRRLGPSAYRVRTFFGEEMEVLLPSSTDIYLTGGKSHPSEIRLARFLAKVLKPGDHFADVGAHYGYFSLLAAARVGSSGKVWAFEAAPKTQAILKRNAMRRPQMEVFSMALAAQDEELTFYEFPNMYSEYNSLDRAQYTDEDWYGGQRPEGVKVPGRRLDGLVDEYDLRPDVIKIDVEGAEDQVISGARSYLQRASPIVIMEVLPGRGKASGHHKAMLLLKELGYHSHILTASGEMEACGDVEGELRQRERESDNVVFVKG